MYTKTLYMYQFVKCKKIKSCLFVLCCLQNTPAFLQKIYSQCLGAIRFNSIVLTLRILFPFLLFCGSSMLFPCHMKSSNISSERVIMLSMQCRPLYKLFQKQYKVPYVMIIYTYIYYVSFLEYKIGCFKNMSLPSI